MLAGASSRRPAGARRRGPRVTTPGTCAGADLKSQRSVVHKLGDRVLGFSDAELKRMLTSAGLRDVRVGIGARKTGDPFTVLLASGVKKK